MELPAEIAQGIEEVIVRGPLGVLLGMELLELGEDRARVRMPYRRELTTAGETVHGGAIAALVDAAGTAAAWAHRGASPEDRGATVGFNIHYLAAAQGATLVATATIRRRGREIATAEVSVRDADDVEIAVALLTYKLSAGAP